MGEDIKNKSWCERILDCMENDRWYSHAQIVKGLNLDWQENSRFSLVLVGYLRRLIKSGYVVRANAPDIINQHKTIKIHYVYRRTGKVWRVNSKYHAHVLALGKVRRNKPQEV